MGKERRGDLVLKTIIEDFFQFQMTRKPTQTNSKNNNNKGNTLKSLDVVLASDQGVSADH